MPNGSGAGIAGLVEKPDADDAPSNLASIGRYVLAPDTFDTLLGLKAGSKRLDPASGLPAVRTWAEEKVFATPSTKGSRKDIASEAKSAYVTKLQFLGRNCFETAKGCGEFGKRCCGSNI